MRKIFSFAVCLFFVANGWGQITTATYNFESLSLGAIHGQDNWEVKSSHSQINNGNVCPPAAGTELPPEIFNAPSNGLYSGSKALKNINLGFGNQHSIISRVDDANWSLPSVSGNEYVILEWDFNGNQLTKGFYLGYDANNDGDFSTDCSMFDTNERSIGISTSAGNTRLHDASGAIVASAPSPSEWTRYRLFIDLSANGNQGNIKVCYRELSNSGNWTEMPGMESINAGFDTSAMNQTNPHNLNGMLYHQEAGGNGNLDNILISTINYDVRDTSACNSTSVDIGQALNGASYIWNNGSTLPTINVTLSDIYYVDITLAPCISFRKYVSVTIDPMPIDLGTDITICDGNNILLDAGPNYTNYQWSNGDSTQTTIIDTAGMYIIDALYTGTVGVDLVKNGNLSSGGSWWHHCGNAVEAYNPETSYGGSNTANTNVAEIDPGTDGIAGTPDDMSLCQSISGFIAGQVYTLCFDYSRRDIAPNPTDMIVTIDGGALNQTIVATNATFNFTQICFDFTATQSTHVLKFTPGSLLYNGSGMIVDNITIPVAPTTGCPVSDSIELFIEAVNQTITSTNPICYGDSNGVISIDNFFATEYSKDGGTTWQTDSFFVNLPEGSYVICSRSTLGCMDTDTVVLENPPIVNVSISSSHSIVCENGTAILNAAATGGTTFTYHWNNALVDSSSHEVSPNSATTYTIFAENEHGCLSDMDSITIDLYPPITGAISPAFDLCENEQAQIDASASGGMGAPYTFTWSNGSVHTSSGSDQIIVAPANTTAYNLAVTDDCESTPLNLICQVNVSQIPEPNYIIAAADSCEPGYFEMVNTTNAALTKHIQWKVNNELFINQDTIFLYDLETGLYNIQMTVVSPDGCIDSTLFINALHVNPNPKANFTFSPSPVLLTNTEVSFNNTSEGADTFEWLFEEGIPDSSTIMHPTATFPEEEIKNYSVTLIAHSEAGCTDTTRKKLELHPTVSIYAPNTFTPNSDYTNDTWKVYMEGIDLFNFDLTLYNRWGELIWESHDISIGWNGTYNNKPAPTGIYTWSIRAKNKLNGGRYSYHGHVYLQ